VLSWLPGSGDSSSLYNLVEQKEKRQRRHFVENSAVKENTRKADDHVRTE